MSSYLIWLLLAAAFGLLLCLATYHAIASRRRSGSQLANGLIVATLVVVFTGCAYGARLEQVGDINCQQADGVYVLGEFGWSISPPGPTCTFTLEEHGFDETRGPTPVMSVWLALVATGAVVTAIVTLRGRARH